MFLKFPCQHYYEIGQHLPPPPAPLFASQIQRAQEEWAKRSLVGSLVSWTLSYTGLPTMNSEKPLHGQITTAFSYQFDPSLATC